MRIIKKTAVIVLTAALAFMLPCFTAYAEEDGVSSEQYSEEENYKTSGDYEYSVKTYDDGSEVAVLENYIGSGGEVEIPETIDGYDVKELGDKTFYLNDKITQITISENLEETGMYPFYGCTSLMEFKVNEKNPIYKADSDGAFVGKQGLLIVAYPTGKNPEKYAVADGVQSIKSSAFAMLTNLKEVTFPDTLNFMGNFAFSECTALESIVLPDSLTELGKFNFSGCTALKNVTLPKNLEVIEDAAFANCKSLESIDFPSTLYEIGQAAFCATGLTSVTIPSTVISIGYSAFGFHTDENDQIVPDEDFIVMGTSGSYAQNYCQETNQTLKSEMGLEEDAIKFVAIDTPTEAETSVSEKSGKKISVVMAVTIGLVCAAVIIIVAIVVVKKSKNTVPDDDESDDVEEDDSDS